jgi:hypothetical protein
MSQEAARFGHTHMHVVARPDIETRVESVPRYTITFVRSCCSVPLPSLGYLPKIKFDFVGLLVHPRKAHNVTQRCVVACAPGRSASTADVSKSFHVPVNDRIKSCRRYSLAASHSRLSNYRAIATHWRMATLASKHSPCTGPYQASL